MPNDDNKKREDVALGKAERILGAKPTVFESPLTVLASPAWRGVEGDVWRAGADGNSIILKHYHPDTEFYVDAKAAGEAARHAGLLGVGPDVLENAPDDRLVVFSDLSPPWRAGGLHDARNLAVRLNVVENKKAYQRGARLEKEVGVFEEIEAFYAIAGSANIATHKDIHTFLAFFRDAEAKIESLGRDLAPCHRDGNSANIMVGPDDAVRLIDFDLAANCDPFEDVGCHLIEFFESDADARGGFEEWYGSFDEGLFQRSMLYGLADDMRWGLIASILAARSPRRSLEFSKYAAWRFLRLEARAKRSEANNRIRMAA